MTDVEVLIINTNLGSFNGVGTAVGGAFAKDAFEQQYGPIAKSQAEGMAPIVTAFYERAPRSDGVDADDAPEGAALRSLDGSGGEDGQAHARVLEHDVDL